MISYFILNKSGNILYQTVPTDKLDTSEQNGIKYLPLLVIKDLIKNNLDTHIQHITTGDKVFAFWERHSLLYIACTKHERIPVSVLHKHLIVMDNFLRFNFGQQYQVRVEGYIYPRSRRHSLQPPLTIKKLTKCLEQLPYVTNYCSLRSPKCLCLIEQVDLQEDLSIRLIEALQQCCNNVFIPPSSNKSTIKFSTLFSQPKKPADKNIFYPHLQRNQHHHQQQQPILQKDTDRPFGVWEHAFLFAREKIVVHACNNNNNNNNNKEQQQSSQKNNSITTDLLYFLKTMVADFIYEYCDTMEQESNLIQHDASVPQAIIPKNTNSNDNGCETSPSTSSQTLCTSISTTGSPSQKSTNFSFIYDSNSSLPFKISSKSSVTQLSSTAVPQISWSSPASSLVHSHLVTRLSKLERGTSHHHLQKNNDILEEGLLSDMMPAMKVHSLTSPIEHYQHYRNQQDDDLTDTSDNTTASAFTTNLPPNAKMYHHHHHHHHQSFSTSISPQLEHATLERHSYNFDQPLYLSSSVPNDDAMMMLDPGKFISNDIMEHRRGASSTNSSPLMRSRRESMLADYSTSTHSQQGKYDSDEGSQDNHRQRQSSTQHHHQQKHLSQSHHHHKTNNNDNNNDRIAKVVQRWVKHGNKTFLSRICILKINESGLVAVILLSDDTLHLPLLFSSTNNNKEMVLHQHNQQMIKQISASLKNALKDFSSFLLTKEVVHFTILSFAFSYPGLVHFVHIKDGILVSPQIVDLNELDKHHEILNIVFETYNIKPTNTMGTIIGKWRWPSVLRLKKLCDKMLFKGLSCQSSTPCIRSIQGSSKKHQGYKLLYLKGEQQDEELLAIYFNFVPDDRIWFMHRKLLVDLGQRHFQK